MPRLLLVDDNPSIHKIAETLLARTGIELVCAETAAQALALVNQGTRFDVALIDTAMTGMDGWELLDELRKHPDTSRIPIAMMAGVLDTIDPGKIQNALIQGFLKKPIELRDLAERVHKLLETPVEAPPPEPARPEPGKASPFETMPSTRLNDLPELRHLNPVAPASAEVAVPEPELDLGSLDDLLELTEEDLLPDEEASPVIEIPSVTEELDEIPEETLDLEELDLDSLRELPPPEVQVGSLPTPIRLQPLTEEVADLTPPEGFLPPPPSATQETPLVFKAAEASHQVEVVDLPDLGPLDEGPLDFSLAEAPAPPAVEIASVEEVIEAKDVVDLPVDMTEDSDSLLSLLEPMSAPEPTFEAVPGTSTEILQIEVPPETPSEDELDYLEETLSGIEMEMQPSAAAVPVYSAPEEATAPGDTVADSSAELEALADEPDFLEIEAAELPAAPVPDAPLVVPAMPAAAAAMPASAVSDSTRDLLDAILADHELMEALTRAVVARLGDKALREIAWEVIPELVERFPTR
jgi:CheY-like chemotaxis protein